MDISDLAPEKERGRVYYKKVGKSGKTTGILSGKIELSGVYFI
jgi:hypothetical protein